MSNWEVQIAEHVSRGFIRSTIYHGDKKSLTAEELRAYDIVITTYQTLAAEMPDVKLDNGMQHVKKKARKKNGLFDVKWKVS